MASSNDIYNNAFDQPGYIDRKSYNLVANVSYQFDSVRLSSLSNYNNVSSEYLGDNDLSPSVYRVRPDGRQRYLQSGISARADGRRHALDHRALFSQY